MTTPGTLGPLEARRGQLNSDAAFTAATQHLVVTATIIGPGEVQLVLSFPIMFIKIPAFSFGSHLADNSTVTSGTYPVVTAVVHRWTTAKVAQGTYWVGAAVGIVSTGPADQNISVDLHFQEMGLRGPTGSTTSTTSGGL